MGTILLALNRSSDALQAFKQECKLASSHHMTAEKSRALGEMGRIYIKAHRFHDAIVVLEARVGLMGAEEAILERVCLLHDLGRCYLELCQFKKAMEAGEKCLSLAETAQDKKWMLQAEALCGQASGKEPLFCCPRAPQS